jgi:hypothetical protein
MCDGVIQTFVSFVTKPHTFIMPLTVTTAGGQLYTLEVTSDTTLEILQQILEVEVDNNSI